MAKISAKDATVGVEDSANTCRAISGDFNQCTLSWTSEDMDGTGFGAKDRERIPNGLRDWTFSMTGFFNADTNAIDAILYGLGPGGSTRVVFGPSGSAAGSIMYTGCAVLQNYEVNSTLTAAVSVTANFASRTGSLTRTTWPA